jgi:zinc protease
VRSGIAPRSQVSIVFTGPFQNDEQHRVIATTMANTLAGNLQRTLREDLGGTYGVNVVPRFTKYPQGEYRLTITFACDPARRDSLVRAAFEVIDAYKRNGPAVPQVADARSALTRDLEANLADNGYLLSRILFKYEFGEDVDEVVNMRPFYDRITVPALRDAAVEYLNTNRYVEVTLVPESR